VLSTNGQVGAYAVAYQIAGFAMSVPTFVLGAAVARYVAADSRGRSQLMHKVLNLFVGVGAPGAVVLIACSGPIIHLLAGHRTDGAILPLQLLLASTLLMWIATAFATALVWQGEEIVAAKVMLGALVLDVVLNVGTDHHFGARGAAFAMIVSQLFAVVFCAVAYCRATSFRPPARLLAATAAGSGAVVVVLVVFRPS